MLTTADVDDEKDPRIVHAFGWLEQRRFADADGCVAALQELCAAGPGVGPPICLHGEDRGTVSSSIVTLRQPLARSEYRHAQGPPDRTPYVDYSHLIEEIAPRD